MRFDRHKLTIGYDFQTLKIYLRIFHTKLKDQITNRSNLVIGNPKYKDFHLFVFFVVNFHLCSFKNFWILSFVKKIIKRHLLSRYDSRKCLHY